MIEYKIKEVVQKRGMSARGLALEAGISPNTAALLIKAKSFKDYNASLDVLDKICNVLNVPLSEIVKYKKG